jgi:succinyl-CoA synthetase alpha subunit
VSKRTLIRRNEYRDSVQLMLAAGQLLKRPGMIQAILMMGTPSNKEFLRNQALLTPEGEAATANDLLITLEADAAEALDHAERDLEGLFRARPAAPGSQAAPRTIDAALRQLPGANLCLVSVPGCHAAAEARKALRAGLHVLLFSDNVPLEQEREVKELARSRGLLCMGPDCGVVNLNGAALALASIVRRGPVGIAGASGTGIQQVAVLVERWGLGVSQAIGLGGRDLRDAVGGLALETALDALDADPETRVIVLVSGAPGAATLEKLLARLRRCRKPVVARLSGTDPATLRAAGVHPAADLEEAAALAVALVPGRESGGLRRNRSSDADGELLQREIRGLKPAQRFVRGLFCGGTFMEEALRILTAALGPIHSNAPLSPELALAGRAPSREHTVVDYGEEEFTLGRPHPVIDPQLRRERLEQEGNDPEVAVILLDIILGPAIHPDPAGAVAETIAAAKRKAADQGRCLSVVASVCGTEGDPQRLSAQEEILRAAGVAVLPSNAQAARLAARIAQRGAGPLPVVDPVPDVVRPQAAAETPSPEVETGAKGVTELFGQELQVVNVGLTLFAEALQGQGVKLVSLDWRPPAGGNAEMAALLEKLGGL